MFYAVCIEKHFTLDYSQKGQDHAFSLNLEEWYEMVKFIKSCKKISEKLSSFDEKLELCLDNCQRPEIAKLLIGDGFKKIQENELQSSIVQRRGILINKNLNKNHIIKKEDICFLRPSPKDSFSPREIKSVLNKKLNTCLNEGDNILKHHIE